MENAVTKWWDSEYTNDQLYNTLSDYSKDVFGSRWRVELQGTDHDEYRTILCLNLNYLDRYVSDPNNRYELEQRGWFFGNPEEVFAS